VLAIGAPQLKEPLFWISVWFVLVPSDEYGSAPIGSNNVCPSLGQFDPQLVRSCRDAIQGERRLGCLQRSFERIFIAGNVLGGRAPEFDVNAAATIPAATMELDHASS
jgi:hypothetical protein